VTAEQRGVGPNLHTDPSAEHLDRERAGGITVRAALEEGAHVRAHAGQPEEPGFGVDQRLQAGRVVPGLAGEIHEHPRVEVAAAGPHHDPAGRSQPHRGVLGGPVADGGEAGAVAEMREDGPAEGLRTEGRDDVLVREAVEPVAADPRVVERAGHSEAPRRLGHAAVEAGVEADDLRELRSTPTEGLDGFERRGEVQGCERDRVVEIGEDGGVDAGGFAKVRAAVHDAVPDRGELVVPRGELGEGLVDGVDPGVVDGRGGDAPLGARPDLIHRAFHR
jgi:hypothetical protein